MRLHWAISFVFVIAVLWAVPPLVFEDQHFAVHMARHIGLVAIAAPIMVLAFPDIAGRRPPPVLIATLIEFVVVWTWHVPSMHALAAGSGAVMALEQIMFLGAGLMVWWGAVAGPALPGAGGLFLTSMHMTLLGALLILAPGDLYSPATGHPGNVEAQQLGGILMLGIGTPIYLLGALSLTATALATPRKGQA